MTRASERAVVYAILVIQSHSDPHHPPHTSHRPRSREHREGRPENIYGGSLETRLYYSGDFTTHPPPHRPVRAAQIPQFQRPRAKQEQSLRCRRSGSTSKLGIAASSCEHTHCDLTIADPTRVIRNDGVSCRPSPPGRTGRRMQTRPPGTLER